MHTEIFLSPFGINQYFYKVNTFWTVHVITIWFTYSKTCLKQSLKKKTKIGFQGKLCLNAGQKYCRMLQGEHSAILSTFIKLPSVIKIFVLSIFEWPLKTGFTVRKSFLNIHAHISSESRYIYFLVSTSILNMVNVQKFRTLFLFLFSN